MAITCGLGCILLMVVLGVIGGMAGAKIERNSHSAEGEEDLGGKK